MRSRPAAHECAHISAGIMCWKNNREFWWLIAEMLSNPTSIYADAFATPI